VDATFGGGGHSRLILQRLGPAGRLIAFDRDADAAANAPDDPRFTLVRSDFRWMHNHLRFLEALPVDGLLADLGVSSHQFDAAHRGFSFRADAALDMRMDQRAPRTAADLLAQLTEAEVAEVLHRYGEVEGARRVARLLIQSRASSPIRTTGGLVEALVPVTPLRDANAFLARVFQALRIAVNDELGSLELLLRNSIRIIRPGGRLVVIAYHSLEDRMVKRFMRTGDPFGREDRDVKGNVYRPFRPTTSRAIKPTDEEIANNPRARSARARMAERI
jgi:16S rRNA (cytosine1402-N4)-methyltransferase